MIKKKNSKSLDKQRSYEVISHDDPLSVILSHDDEIMIKCFYTPPLAPYDMRVKEFLEYL